MSFKLVVLTVMKKQLDRISKSAEMLMSKKEISAEAKQQLETAVKVSNTKAMYSHGCPNN